MSEDKYSITLLKDRKSFHEWNNGLMGVILEKDLYDAVKGKSSNEGQKQKLIGIIIKSLHESIRRDFMGLALMEPFDPKALYESLKTKFGMAVSPAEKQFYIDTYNGISMGHDQSVDEYSSYFNGAYEDVRSVDPLWKPSETSKIHHFLAGISRGDRIEYEFVRNHITCTLQEIDGKPSVSLDAVKSMLLAKEGQIRIEGKKKEEELARERVLMSKLKASIKREGLNQPSQSAQTGQRSSDPPREMAQARGPPHGPPRGGFYGEDRYCNHCQKPHHTEATCFKLHPEQRPPNWEEIIKAARERRDRLNLDWRAPQGFKGHQVSSAIDLSIPAARPSTARVGTVLTFFNPLGVMVDRHEDRCDFSWMPDGGKDDDSIFDDTDSEISSDSFFSDDEEELDDFIWPPEKPHVVYHTDLDLWTSDPISPTLSTVSDGSSLFAICDEEEIPLLQDFETRSDWIKPSKHCVVVPENSLDCDEEIARRADAWLDFIEAWKKDPSIGEAEEQWWSKRKSVPPEYPMPIPIPIPAQPIEKAMTIGLCKLHDQEEMVDLSTLWVADSGATQHITSKKDYFLPSTYRGESSRTIHAADDHPLQVIGTGDVLLPLDKGKTVLLRDVLHVPQVPIGVVSTNKLVDAGGYIFEHSSKAMVYEMLGTDLSPATLYFGRAFEGPVKGLNILHAPPSGHVGDLALVVRYPKLTGVELAIQQHRALGHISMVAHLRALKEGLVDGLGPVTENDIKEAYKHTCEACMANLTRNVADTPPTQLPRGTKEHERVMWDLMVFKHPTFGGATYCLSILAQSSKFGGCFPIKSKSDAPSKIIDFIRFTEKWGANVCLARSDRAKEFQGYEIEEALRRMGIKHELTAPYAHEAGGEIEVFNGIMQRRLRAMMADSGLPIGLWGELLTTCCYLYNLSTPTRLSITPWEAVYGKKPNVSHLMPIGSIVYSLHPLETRSKADKGTSRSQLGHLVGYEEGGNAYRIWGNGTIIVSKDVAFSSSTTMEDIARDGFKKSTVEWTDFSDDAPSLPLLTAPPSPLSPVPATQDPAAPTVFYDATSQTPPSPHVQMVNPVATRTSTRSNAGIKTSLRFDEEFANKGSNRIGMVCITVESQHRYIREALEGPNADLWRKAYDKEIKAFEDKGVFTWVSKSSIPPETEILPNHIVLTETYDDDSKELTKVKVRLVARGDRQRFLVHYENSESPTVSPDSIRLLLGEAVNMDFVIRQFDVSTAYLNGVLDEEIYMAAPYGMEGYKPGYCWKLNKAVYGLKQAGRAWYYTMRHQLLEFGWAATTLDPCVFFKDLIYEGVSYRIFLTLYVDDALLMGPKVVESLLIAEEDKIDQAFPITRIPIGSKDYLGMRLKVSDGIITLDQGVYIDIMVNAFGQSDSEAPLSPCDSSALSLVPAKDSSNMLDLQTYPYMSLVGSLLWVSTRSRPDVSFIVGVLCRAMTKPTMAHWNSAIRVVRYLKGTRDLSLVFSKEINVCSRGSSILSLAGFTDSDYAGDLSTRKSTSAYAFLRYGLISWGSRLQELITLSSMEAELVAACNATKHGSFLKQMIQELGLEKDDPLPLFGDNQACLSWVNTDDMVSRRTKHIDVRYHYIREAIQSGLISFSYVNTHDNLADLMTKPLPFATLVKFREALGLRFVA